MKELASALEHISDISSGYGDLKTECKTLHESLERHTLDKMETQRQMEAMRDSAAENEIQLQSLRTELASSTGVIVDLRGSVSGLESRVHNLSLETEELSKERAVLSGRCQELQEEVSSLTASNTRLGVELEAAQDQLSAKTVVVSKLRQDSQEQTSGCSKLLTLVSRVIWC